jgi:hypothetical protein
VGWAAANWILDAASLYVFIAAFHKLVSPIDLFVAYGLANILAVIPITPSGLGVVEGVLIPTLVGFGVPNTNKQALLAVLGWRLVNFWLPIPVGGAAYLSLQLTGGGWRQRLRFIGDEVVDHPDPDKTSQNGSHREGDSNAGIPSDPVNSDPVNTDPVNSDPVNTDPVNTDPVNTDPMPTDPIPTDPMPTDPMPTDPMPTDPMHSAPVKMDRVDNGRVGADEATRSNG